MSLIYWWAAHSFPFFILPPYFTLLTGSFHIAPAAGRSDSFAVSTILPLFAVLHEAPQNDAAPFPATGNKAHKALQNVSKPIVILIITCALKHWKIPTPFLNPFGHKYFPFHFPFDWISHMRNVKWYVQASPAFIGFYKIDPCLLKCYCKQTDLIDQMEIDHQYRCRFGFPVSWGPFDLPNWNIVEKSAKSIGHLESLELAVPQVMGPACLQLLGILLRHSKYTYIFVYSLRNAMRTAKQLVSVLKILLSHGVQTAGICDMKRYFKEFMSKSARFFVDNENFWVALRLELWTGMQIAHHGLWSGDSVQIPFQNIFQD